MKQRNPIQLAQILECMQLAKNKIKTDHINDIHDNIFQYRLKGMSDKMSKLCRNGYVTVENCKKNEITIDGCIKWYSLTEKGKEKGVVPIIEYKHTPKTPRSSLEESIVKKQNKILNDRNFVSLEDLQEFLKQNPDIQIYRNSEEGKLERGTQIIKTNLFVSIKNFLLSKKNDEC